jgi:hypothetical protein
MGMKLPFTQKTEHRLRMIFEQGTKKEDGQNYTVRRFITWALYKLLFTDETLEDKMHGICSTYEMMKAYNFLFLEQLKER